MKNVLHPIGNDSGVVLASVLALILALTAASVVLINMTSQEMDVSGNNKCQAQAFFSAESGMRGMMKVLDRTVEEAELVSNTDQQYAGFTYTGSDATEEYRQVFFGGKTADANSTKTEKFQFSESVAIAPSADNDNPFHTYANLADGFDADVDFSRTHGATLEGATLEFAAGYEGLGSGAGSMAYFFRIVSQGHGCGRSNYTVNGEYRYVTR